VCTVRAQVVGRRYSALVRKVSGKMSWDQARREGLGYFAISDAEPAYLRTLSVLLKSRQVADNGISRYILSAHLC
jgi:hypothetical protein